MQGSRIMKSTIVAVAIAMGVLAMPVGAAQPRDTSTSTRDVSITSAAVAVATSTSTTTYALNTMKNLPLAGTTASGTVFHGTANIINFQNVNNRIMAIVGISGKLVRPNGTIVGRVTGVRARMPVTLSDGTNVHSSSLTPNAAGVCDILHLHLGALDLNLLGLIVHLDPVRLDITAAPGPGNLLGNLLCAVSGLLDQTGVNGVLVNLLRAIQQILNGL
jgi:hypothetical protein